MDDDQVSGNGSFQKPNTTFYIAFAALVAGALLILLRLAASSSEPGGGEVIVLKAGHSSNTDEPYHLGLVEFARIANERSNGKLKIEIYPSMQLGSEKVMIEGLLLGTLDIVVTANGSATNFVPQLGILDLPFLFRDRDHMYRVLDGEIGRELKIASNERGLRLLGYYDAGIRHVMTTERPVRSYDDMGGLKIRTMPVPAHLASFNAFGAQAVAIDYGELYGGLQTGLIDGAEAANTNYSRQKLFEVAPHWAQVGWIILVADVLMSEAKFQSLPKEMQSILVEAGQQSAILERKLYARSDDSLLAELERHGVRVTYPDREPFRMAAENVYDKFVRTHEDRELLNMILAK